MLTREIIRWKVDNPGKNQSAAGSVVFTVCKIASGCILTTCAAKSTGLLLRKLYYRYITTRWYKAHYFL